MKKQYRTLLAISTLIIAGNLMADDKELVEGQHKGAGIEAHAVLEKEKGNVDSYTDLGLGLFLHWSISSVKEMNISWPMIPGRALVTGGGTQPGGAGTRGPGKGFQP